MKKKVAVTVFVLIVALTAGAFAVYRHVALPAFHGADPGLVATEESLATPDLLLLASLDIAYLRALETKLYGNPRMPDLVLPDRDAMSATDEIRRSLARQYGSLAFVTAAVYLTAAGPATVIVYGGGDVRAAQAVAFLKNHPRAKPSPALPNAWVVQTEDLETCQLSKEWTLLVDKNRVIVTDAPHAAAIARLQAGASAARDLAQWREFRAARFAAATMFRPASLPEAGMDPMARAVANGADQGLRDFDTVYLGARAASFPPKVDLSLWLGAKSASVAAQTVSGWQAALAASRRDWQHVLPTFAVLHDRAEFTTRDNLVRADVRLDETVVEQLTQLPGELLALIFSGFDLKVRPGEAPGAAPTERLAQNPKRYIAVVNSNEIRPYDQTVPFADTADVITGPFGVYVDAIRLLPGNIAVTEIEVAAKGTHLPNVDDNAEHLVGFAINSVKDANGKELLKVEPCGRDRNERPAPAQSMFGQPMVGMKKAVRLAPGVQVGDVTRIEGAIRARLPMRVEVVALKAPKAGDLIERENLRIEVTRADAGRIAYRVSGDSNRLMEVRAKNAKGQVLANSSRMSMGGTAKSVSQEFQGEAAEVEFAVASVLTEHTFPFVLTDVMPGRGDPRVRMKALAFAPYAPAQLKRDLAKPFEVRRFSSPKGTAAAGPIVVDIERVLSFRSLELHMASFLPPLENLEGALTAAVLDVDSLTLTDGSVQRPTDANAPWRLFLPLSSKVSYLEARGRIDTGIKTERETQVKSITGRVSLRLPVKLKHIRIPGRALGAVQETACGPVRLTQIGRERVEIAGAGDAGCIFAVRPIDAAGQELWTSSGEIAPAGAGWSLTLDVKGGADTFELVMAPKSQVKTYPFTLELGASNPPTTAGRP